MDQVGAGGGRHLRCSFCGREKPTEVRELIAGPGVYMKQISASIDSAQVEVVAKVANASDNTRFFIAQVTVLDERNKTVTVGRASGAVSSGGAQDLKQTIARRAGFDSRQRLHRAA